ncbi:hypothetical protein KRX51_03105 [Corynebacterium sp. TAE3-ERU12]|uniref:hypothetical protein n=1 Tax=Corynebacterium sp. TAE3-ERU12 TaxID=2849491 RepID=UPI001C4720DA|nr:hypothetical protein [Corynebacterium sp. TAE3-ERU12]MBV7294906.1 hypothetical protein [Corynebacterium sp. TAE3-ERU12]
MTPGEEEPVWSMVAALRAEALRVAKPPDYQAISFGLEMEASSLDGTTNRDAVGDLLAAVYRWATATDGVDAAATLSKLASTFAFSDRRFLARYRDIAADTYSQVIHGSAEGNPPLLQQGRVR